jgi:hypothetical protein
MSGVTSGNRLPVGHPVHREVPDHNWSAYLLGGLVIVALAYLFAFVAAILGGGS